MTEMPILDRDRCDLCGLCVEVCRCQAIVWQEDTISITETEDCGWCALCEAVCPHDAITCAYEIIFSTDDQ